VGRKRQVADRAFIVVHSQGDLFEVVCTLDSSCRLPRRLHRRKQQGDQNADDRDDDQEFDQREAAKRFATEHHVTRDEK
jgi:hypothetical protein